MFYLSWFHINTQWIWFLIIIDHNKLIELIMIGDCLWYYHFLVNLALKYLTSRKKTLQRIAPDVSSKEKSFTTLTPWGSCLSERWRWAAGRRRPCSRLTSKTGGKSLGSSFSPREPKFWVIRKFIKNNLKYFVASPWKYMWFSERPKNYWFQFCLQTFLN
jgi:hypothetical protein